MQPSLANQSTDVLCTAIGSGRHVTQGSPIRVSVRTRSCLFSLMMAVRTEPADAGGHLATETEVPTRQIGFR